MNKLYDALREHIDYDFKHTGLSYGSYVYFNACLKSMELDIITPSLIDPILAVWWEQRWEVLRQQKYGEQI